MRYELAVGVRVNSWTAIATWLGIGAGAGGGFATVRWFFEWAGGRFDKRSDRIDASTERLIHALETRIDTLTVRLELTEQLLAECNHKHAISEAKTLRLEAMVMAFSEGREHAQIILSSERVQARSEEKDA